MDYSSKLENELMQLINTRRQECLRGRISTSINALIDQLEESNKRFESACGMLSEVVYKCIPQPEYGDNLPPGNLEPALLDSINAFLIYVRRNPIGKQ